MSQIISPIPADCTGPHMILVFRLDSEFRPYLPMLVTDETLARKYARAASYQTQQIIYVHLPTPSGVCCSAYYPDGEVQDIVWCYIEAKPSSRKLSPAPRVPRTMKGIALHGLDKIRRYAQEGAAATSPEGRAFFNGMVAALSEFLHFLTRFEPDDPGIAWDTEPTTHQKEISNGQAKGNASPE